ncbi:hypothetical protein [Deinococcus sp.]|uniref:hypothetical protein n=1 Tax=Deinococcus sp. TaxID=47478 RepID=UPI0026011D2E|nr:hypothetical protein [Deinococcus sp.]
MNETPSVTEQMYCVWVPGTSDRVRLTLSGRVIECSLSLVAKVFGARRLDDLYLRGRAVLPFSQQQLAQLA